VGWYAAVAATAGGPVLELACGTGRVAVPLAAATGLPVVGLDVDMAMVAAARRRGLTAAVLGDMRRFSFAATFALVFIAYNSIQLLDETGRADCLASVAAVLRTGGQLALECTDFQRGVEVTSVGPERLASHDGITLYGSVQHDLVRRTSVYRRRFEHQGLVHIDEVTIASVTEDDILGQLATVGWRPLTTERDGARFRVVATLAAP
jgi:SAM-dependent methyltransferase